MADTQKPLNVADEKALKEALAIPTAPHITRPQHCCVSEFWAVVETNGTLVRGRNVVRSKRLAPGVYEVVFTEDLSLAVFVATIGRPAYATEPTGQISVALRCCLPSAENNKGVWVDTHDSTGAFSDRAFHLLVLKD
ncbi:MAG TPA: hypothetical protein VGO73_07415 [Pyrinomonadaceae bacterium]|jgi:hypothetical protein|nr:hypothetical protein [Pyrinomonadaceae bacterium]